MRRKDKAVSDASGINAIIEISMVCRLGLVDGDKPYIVPLSFGYQDHTLYFHGALKGRKIDLLKENPNVCVEFDIAVEALKNDRQTIWFLTGNGFPGSNRMSIGNRNLSTGDTQLHAYPEPS
jgi:hypothetical protein